MARRTHEELLVDVLRAQPLQRASARKLAEELDWPVSKIQIVVDKCVANPLIQVSRGKGGSIQFHGSEQGRESGLYMDVNRVLTEYWAPRRGLKNVRTYFTARGGKRGSGVFVHPDLVLFADPPRKRYREEPSQIHVFEIEHSRGFGLASIYQAHAQGRGADFTWVIAANDSLVLLNNAERVDWTVENLGVGLIEFGRPGSWTTWNERHPADRRGERPNCDKDDGDREDFLHQVLGKDHDEI